MAKARIETHETMTDGARHFGDRMIKLGRNAFLFGLGTVATAEEEMRGVFDRMISKGEDLEEREESLIRKATSKAKELGTMVEDGFQATVSTTLNRAGIPSQNEMRMLIERVEELTAKVEALGGAR